MKFSLKRSIEVLQRTPDILSQMLQDISEDWTLQNEGEGTWSVFDIVGHLIHGEKWDWLLRAEIILSNKNDKTFEPFDRFAQFENNKGKHLNELLIEFKEARTINLDKLDKLKISKEDFNRTGNHPVFGSVSLSQLLSTWVVHDLNHISQISRVMAKQYKEEVGPWIEYLRILKY